MAIYDISCQNLFLWSEKAFFQAGIKALQVFVNRFQIAPVFPFIARTKAFGLPNGQIEPSSRLFAVFSRKTRQLFHRK